MTVVSQVNVRLPPAFPFKPSVFLMACVSLSAFYPLPEFLPCCWQTLRTNSESDIALSLSLSGWCGCGRYDVTHSEGEGGCEAH